MLLNLRHKGLHWRADGCLSLSADTRLCETGCYPHICPCAARIGCADSRDSSLRFAGDATRACPTCRECMFNVLKHVVVF